MLLFKNQFMLRCKVHNEMISEANVNKTTRGVAVDLEAHCNIGSKRECCCLASNY